MTQKQIILNRLKSGTWFSTVECVRDFHILRLVFDLRAEGYNIIERKVAGKSWSEYKLIPAVAPVMPPAFPQNPMLENKASQSLFP
jgi:hypothetical protein